MCNYQNKSCGCQTYLDENNPKKCFYCDHYNAFHTNIINIIICFKVSFTINIKQYNRLTYGSHLIKLN